MRGNHRHTLRELVGRGSIPACAGEPSVSFGTKSVPMVYPRVCGGTLMMKEWSLSRGGLSPRVRGNPWCGRMKSPWVRSYPRVCGGTAYTTP